MNKSTTKQVSNSKLILFMGIGSTITLSFSVLTGALLSRYLPIDEYATYRQVLLIYSTFLYTFAMSVPRAYTYFLAQSPMSEGESIASKINKLLLLIGTTLALILYLSAPLFADAMNNQDIKYALRIFSPTIIFMLPSMGVDAISSTYRNSIIFTKYTILSRTIMLAFVIAPVIYFDCDYTYSLIGYSVSSLIMYMLSIFYKNVAFRGVESVFCDIKYKTILRYMTPIMLGTIFGLLFSFTGGFFISRYYGSHTFAHYSNGMIDIPFIITLSISVTAVLTPLFVKMGVDHDFKGISQLWDSTLTKVIVLFYPIILFCIFFADNIITVVYGSNYAESAIYFQINAVSNLFILVNFSAIITAIGKLKKLVIIQALIFLLAVTSQYLSAELLESPLYIAISYSSLKILSSLLYILVVAKFIDEKLINLIPWRLALKISGVCVLILFGVREVVDFDSSLLNLIVGGLLFYLVFYFISKPFDYIKIYDSVIHKIVSKIIKHEKDSDNSRGV